MDRIKRFSRGFGIALVVATLVGCGPLPRPFQPESKDLGDLSLLDQSSRILILPLQTTDGTQTPSQAEAYLVSALSTENVAATIEETPFANRILVGRSMVVALDSGIDEILLQWELTDGQGQRITTFGHRSELPRGYWQEGRAEAVKQVMGEAASAIAAVVRPPPIKEAKIPGFPGARLVLVPLQPLPGDGEKSLLRALERELIRQNFPVASEASEDDILIAGKVALDPPISGSQRIAVTWRISRASNDARIGFLTQENRLPAGSLDGPWGKTATAIARSAVGGISDILEQAGRT